MPRKRATAPSSSPPLMVASPLFALVDCNNFYVSCERLFQPALEGRPVVALSTPTTAAAWSRAAKKPKPTACR
ncbi:hypothetical protein [Rhabdochromatium marinum]|uniref:Y-family DNA polymerase n=1 Tax=Rhabdochromatium marinum TaxID=48729 RepID=UPI00190382EE|nr:hypothetical protein [Rhabdochromatium marinum]